MKEKIGDDKVPAKNGHSNGTSSIALTKNLFEMEETSIKNQKILKRKYRFYKSTSFLCTILCLLFLLFIGLCILYESQIRDKYLIKRASIMVNNYSLPNPLELVQNENNNEIAKAGALPNPLRINDNENNNVNKSWMTALEKPPPDSLHAIYKNAAVASDHSICSEIGRNILIAGGNAVDSAIATLIGIGVVNPQSSGIGGSTIMTIYDASAKKAFSIDARGTAPSSANSTMFIGK